MRNKDQILLENIYERILLKENLVSEYDSDTKRKMDKFLTNVIKENVKDIPKYLYHATYRPLLKKIKKMGLDTSSSKKSWEDSVSGYVYLALDPDVAESYAEESENVSDDWLDEIIILTIDTDKIDKSKLFIDQNVQDNQGDTLEYRGVISPEALQLYKKV